MEILFVILFVIFVAVLLTELAFSPRVDRTRKGVVILWYGLNKRKFILIYKQK